MQLDLFQVISKTVDINIPKNIIAPHRSSYGVKSREFKKVQINFSPSSTVIGSAILNGIFAEAIVIMAENGFQPPVLLSGNMAGADSHNNKIINRYKNRIQL